MSNFNYHKRSLNLQTLQHGFVSLPLLLLVLSSLSARLPAVAAQQPTPTPDNQYPYARFSPSMAIIIVVLISALFFMGFFSIYIRHCNDRSSTGNSIRQTLSMRRRTAASRGLDASVLETFPTFTYAEVKDHKVGKGALECAVCLNEFQDDETLRLIPKCDHVFHPECIDAWLESHVTCPVCRANLVPGPAEEQLPEVPVAAANESSVQEEANNQPRIDEVSIHVEGDDQYLQQRGGEEAEQSARPEVMNRSGSLNRPPRSLSIKIPRMFGKFRSHSTGHSLAANSLVVPGENLDRFTLRLPEQVRKEVMTRTGSYAGRLPREGSTRRGNRTGDGSSRGARSYRRIDPSDRAAKSDRWAFLNAPQFFSRALSIKSPKVTDNGEGSTSSKSPRPAVRMPSFKCLEPKSADETSLVRSDSARPPV